MVEASQLAAKECKLSGSNSFILTFLLENETIDLCLCSSNPALVIAIPTAPSCPFLGTQLLEASTQETMPLCSKHLASEHDLELSFREVKCVRQVK